MAITATISADRWAHRPADLLAWLRLVLCVLGRGYRAFFLTLLAAAMVPSLWGWSSYVVRSGSMEPSIGVGDVVVARPFSSSDEMPLGRVVVFPNPTKPGDDQLLVHRVVERLSGGGYATAGDANATNDASPITVRDVEARAVILVPFVGKPLVWFEDQQVLALLLLSLLTLTALVFATRPPVASTDGPDGPSEDGLSRERPWRRRHRRRRTRRSRAAALASTLMVLVLGGVAAGGTHAASGSFISQTASSSNTWTVARWPVERYTSQVLADSPYVYYQVDEASGASMADSSGKGRTGTYTGVSAYRQTGALPNNTGYAVALAGGTGRLVSGGSSVQDPNLFSLELWFRTSTTAGGKLIGFESTRNATSATYDRHVLMRPDGRLVYGAWNAPTVSSLVTPAAYNNGGWHHLVVTTRPHGQQQDTVVYVDGNAVASGTTTRTAFYSGWWRVGYGSLTTGAGLPASARFTGHIDQVAVYQSELSASRVASHWSAR